MKKNWKVLLFVAALVFVIGSAFAPLVNMGSIDEDSLFLLMGSAMSLIFSFLPGLNTWYAAKPENVKKRIMAIVLVVLSGGIYAGMCFGLITTENMVCDANGLINLLKYTALAIVGNQGIFKLTNKTAEVKRLSAKAG